MSTPTKRKSSNDIPSPAPKKGGALLSPQTIDFLRAWMMSPEHINHPYPTDDEKAKIMEDTGISSKQLTCWFSNNRKRYWKPKMEEMGKGDVVEAAMGNTLSAQAIDYLKAWMMSPEHVSNPYPTEEEKYAIMAATGIEKKQLTCWFSNNRKRFWKPKMDKLRKEYGLAENNPLPPALLSVAAAPGSTSTTASALPSGDFNHSDAAITTDTVTHTDIFDPPTPNIIDVNDPEISNQTDIANLVAAAAAPQVGPLAANPLEDFTEDFYGSNIGVSPHEVHPEVQCNKKRQKVATDDVVAV